MPIFSDLILRNDQQIKESLRLVFLEISKSLNDNMKLVQAFQMSTFSNGSDTVATGSVDNTGRDSSGSSGGRGD